MMIDFKSLMAGFIIGYMVVGLIALCVMMYTGDLTRDFKEDDDGKDHTAD